MKEKRFCSRREWSTVPCDHRAENSVSSLVTKLKILTAKEVNRVSSANWLRKKGAAKKSGVGLSELTLSARERFHFGRAEKARFETTPLLRQSLAATKRWSISLQSRGDPVVGGLAKHLRKIMPAVGMDYAQAFARSIQVKHRPGCDGDPIDARRAEILIALRRNHQHRSRSQTCDQLGKVEGNLLQPAAVLGQARHVAGLGPTFFRHPDPFVTVVIIEKRIEPAAGDDDADARVKEGGKDRVVAAQRMANRSKKRCQERMALSRTIECFYVDFLSNSALSTSLGLSMSL